MLLSYFLTAIQVIALVVVGSVTLVGMLYAELSNAHKEFFSEFSIGAAISTDQEEPAVNISTDPYATADAFLLEAREIWESPEYLWKAENSKSKKAMHEFLVQSRPVKGGYENIGIPVQRVATKMSSSASALDVFRFLTGPDGFAIIDESSTNETLYKEPLAAFDWDRGRLEVAHTFVPMFWPLLDRHFLVYNVIDESTCTFVSKSISPFSENMNDAILEGNKWQNDTIRAINLFGVRIADCGRDISASAEIIDGKQPLLADGEQENTTDFSSKEMQCTAGNDYQCKQCQGERMHTYDVQMLNFVGNIIPNPAMGYYFMANMFFQKVVPNLQSATVNL